MGGLRKPTQSNLVSGLLTDFKPSHYSVFRQAIQPHVTRFSGQCLRMFVCALAWVATLIVVQAQVYAGCHYGDGRSFQSALQSDNPREHARNFQFLGQWIYEAGEIKYVPWQGAPPCQGPNCHADDPLPQSTSAPAPDSSRMPTVIFGMSLHEPVAADDGQRYLVSSELSPLKGYPHEHEYPP
jgi:hypothetical protein